MGEIQFCKQPLRRRRGWLITNNVMNLPIAEFFIVVVGIHPFIIILQGGSHAQPEDLLGLV